VCRQLTKHAKAIELLQVSLSKATIKMSALGTTSTQACKQLGTAVFYAVGKLPQLPCCTRRNDVSISCLSFSEFLSG